MSAPPPVCVLLGGPPGEPTDLADCLGPVSAAVERPASTEAAVAVARAADCAVVVVDARADPTAAVEVVAQLCSRLDPYGPPVLVLVARQHSEAVAVALEGREGVDLVVTPVCPAVMRAKVRHSAWLCRRSTGGDALRLAESRLDAAVRGARLGVWEYDVAAAVNYQDDRCRELFGLRADELPAPSERVFALIHPDDRPRVQRQVSAALAGHLATPFETEYRAVRPDGTTRHLYVRGHLAPTAGRSGRVVGIAVDVTEQRLAEARLRRSEEQFRGLSEASPAGIFQADLNGNVLYVNPRLAALWGRTPEELLGRRWADGVHPEDAGALLAGWAEASATGRGYEHVYRVVRPGGEVRWAHGRSAVTRDADGRPTGTVGSVDDVTERRALEAQLRQSAKLEAVGRLAAGIAHDFNNMLTAVIGFADLAADRLAPPDPARQHVVEARRAADRAAGLTRQLLAFTRQQVLAPRVFDPNAMVASALAMLRQLVGDGVHLVTALDDRVWPVRADPGQVEQALVNLCVNARDAMPGGGRLTVATRNAPDGEAVELSVADTGGGIPADVLPHIFDPFFTTKGVGRGTGLGLATVHGIVVQSGGRIDVESAPGRGATFRVFLPRAREVAPHVREGASPPGLPGTETVLVVEDEEVVRELVTGVLRSSGYRVLAAAGREEAERLEAAEAGPLHLLVTDVVMPGWSGPQVADALRAARPGLAVLYMSGHTVDDVVRYGVAEDRERFLQKPFTPSQLLTQVRAVLTSGSRPGTRAT